MKIRYTNFRRVIDIGALHRAGESIVVLTFFITIFGGLAYFFKDQIGFALFFAVLTIAFLYALILEVIGILPSNKQK